MPTATQLSHRSLQALSVVDAVSALAIRLALAPVRFYRSRAALTQLAALGDHELSDIGLTRADIAAAGSLPVGDDPTLALARTVQERRRWRRAG
jgi:uncharacterized protein YjiS (DUF1127 family)